MSRRGRRILLAQKWRDIPIQCLSDIMTTSGHGQNIVTGRADMRCRKGNLPSEGMKIISRVYSGGANRPKMVTHINFLKILSIGRKSHAIRVPRKKISNPRPFEVSRVGFGGWKLSFPCQGRLFITKVGPINFPSTFLLTNYPLIS